MNRLLATGEVSIMAVPLDEPADAFEGAFDLFVAAGVAGTDVAFAVGAKGAAGDDGHSLFGEEAFAESDAIHAGDGDIGEGVKGAFGFECGQADGAEAIDDEATAAVVT